MNKKTTLPQDYSKPVAYDVDGKPLYAHPPVLDEKIDSDKIQNVNFVRPREPVTEEVSDAVRLKHLKSIKIYPGLNLSEGEYVIAAVKRHPIGLVVPTILGMFLMITSLLFLAKFDSIAGLVFKGQRIGSESMVFPVIMFICMVFLANYIIISVYNKNKLFLTNESLIQHIQTTIFSKRERVISLMDIEDVSFTQKGVMQSLFNYGSIRLSTEGEGTTYSFSYASNPKETVSDLSNAIEAFKYGRVVPKS
jgi:hypothetical protein